jgi:hypothetical protein
VRLQLTTLILVLSVICGTLIPAASYAADGGVAGGGGNSILCNDGKYYSYDFIVTQKSTGKMIQAFAYMNTPEQILKRIAEIMAMKVPAMAESLNDFIISLNTGEFDVNFSSRVWVAGLNPLTPIGDESRLRIPSMCLDSKGEPKILQAVIRFVNDANVIQYNFDENQIYALRRNSALQMSFLYLHEWLSDYTQNAGVIMNIDRMLHEDGWIAAPPEGVLAAMKRYGLNTANLKPFVPKPLK